MIRQILIASLLRQGNKMYIATGNIINCNRFKCRMLFEYVQKFMAAKAGKRRRAGKNQHARPSGGGQKKRAFYSLAPQKTRSTILDHFAHDIIQRLDLALAGKKMRSQDGIATQPVDPVQKILG